VSCEKDILNDINFNNKLKQIEKKWNVVFPINFYLNETYGKADFYATWDEFDTIIEFANIHCNQTEIDEIQVGLNLAKGLTEIHQCIHYVYHSYKYKSSDLSPKIAYFSVWFIVGFMFGFGLGIGIVLAFKRYKNNRYTKISDKNKNKF
jgi:hypothetical protein